jgi:hypothetical protein
MKMLWSETDVYSGHFRRYNKKEVNRLLKDLNCKKVRQTYFFSVFFLPVFLLRVIPNLLGSKKSYEEIVDSELLRLENCRKLRKLIKK